MKYIFLFLTVATTNLYATDWFIIVDAVSNGNTLAPYIRQKAEQLNREVKIIHVKSVPEYTHAFRPSFHPEHFDELYELNENGTNLMQIVNSLKKHENLFPALPGTEIAVPLADQINTRAELEGNRLDLSYLKNNKGLLYKFLYDKGLITAPSGSVSNVNEGLQWIRETGISFSIVAKPVDDAGGYGFTVIDSINEFENPIRQLFKRTNYVGKPITSIVLQPKLLGNEYAINGAVRGDRIVFTDVIQYEKEGAVYLKDELLDPIHPKVAQLIADVIKTLKSMGFTAGAFHFEIIDSKQYGMVLIDAAGRAMGGKDYRMVRECTKYTQVMAIVDRANASKI